MTGKRIPGIGLYRRLALAARVLLVGGPALMAALPCSAVDQHYQGTAYADRDGRAVYREEHWVYENQGAAARLVLYKCPGGEPFARKWVKYDAGTFNPDFDLLDNRDGYREGVRSRDGRREAYVQEGRQAPLKTAFLPARPGGVIDAGFDAYVRDHWEELGQRQGGNIPFLVPSRLEFFDLKLGGAADSADGGESVRRLHLSMNAWYGFIAPALDLTYSASDRRLLRFQGISNIRDAAGRNQKVRIEFPATGRLAPATRQEIEAAANAPLTGQCLG